jgi:ketosteroid isomerase-like protein
MPNETELLVHLYDRFNARDMEAVLTTMHQDVVWANGLDHEETTDKGRPDGLATNHQPNRRT